MADDRTCERFTDEERTVRCGAPATWSLRVTTRSGCMVSTLVQAFFCNEHVEVKHSGVIWAGEQPHFHDLSLSKLPS